MPTLFNISLQIERADTWRRKDMSQEIFKNIALFRKAVFLLIIKLLSYASAAKF